LGTAVLAVIIWTQIEKRFLFFPTQEIAYTPGQAGLDYEEAFFFTQDGLRLHGWYVPGRTDVTWLWFHGNGGNISHRVDEMALIQQRLGVNQFIFDYQGYGRSEGRPTEQGTYRDARAALEYLQNRPDGAADRIVYFGRSLGAAVAVELATSQPPLGMVLVSPFASVGDMVRLTTPFFPVRWLVRWPVQWLVGNRYDSLARIGRDDRPLLILHGDQDQTVPVSQGKKLFEAANSPKQFRLLAGAGHNDTYSTGGAEYWDALTEFMAALPGQGSSTETR
jgi:fermentation-respiration switch protein FrsA (DUF1100 family)